MNRRAFFAAPLALIPMKRVRAEPVGFMVPRAVIGTNMITISWAEKETASECLSSLLPYVRAAERGEPVW